MLITERNEEGNANGVNNKKLEKKVKYFHETFKKEY